MHTCTVLQRVTGSVSLNVVNSIVYFINRNEKKRKKYMVTWASMGEGLKPLVQRLEPPQPPPLATELKRALTWQKRSARRCSA